MKAANERTNHILPGGIGGDTSWFLRQNPFEQQEILRQVAFKNKYWPGLENGRFAKNPQHTYPHILPDGNVSRSFYVPIAEEILHYLDSENIALHSEALNLKSSQVACLNFLYPFRLNLSLATAVFKFLLPGLELLTGIEFEYTGPLEATKWLGEPLGGKRGQNRTSIDAAVFWADGNNQQHATLIEWKYTEHNFGVCSAFSSGSQEEQRRCAAIQASQGMTAQAQQCLLTTGQRNRSRHYWEHLEEAGISLDKFSAVGGCPFQGPLYQLMRQHLLGTFLIKSHIVDHFEIVSMDFGGNKSLHLIPPHLEPMTQQRTNNIIDLWNSSLTSGSKMRHITVEEFMKHVDNIGMADMDWRQYIAERYSV